MDSHYSNDTSVHKISTLECEEWKMQLHDMGIEDSDIRKLEEFNLKVLEAMKPLYFTEL